ncbi:hypothetical protein GALMADRAFT_160132 [Galerina marginata CBS 339.88]|uniref:EF-hand domain-containing protein n=1 Tax=Galerina marginata (strain CBS 339.88) TaxID=685588 RepID=A0A067SJ07_GALM3|nr:hypothetical protein GALMADRAFT_160132 [Galerina marginata CBS 339.88]
MSKDPGLYQERPDHDASLDTKPSKHLDSWIFWVRPASLYIYRGPFLKKSVPAHQQSRNKAVSTQEATSLIVPQTLHCRSSRMSTASKSKANPKISHPSSTPNVQGEVTQGTTNSSIRKDNKIDKLFDEFQGRLDGLPALKEGVTEIFSIVKGQIGNFVQSSDGLMKALDEVGKMHPFIMSRWNNLPSLQHLTRAFCLPFIFVPTKVAVIPFKAALSLELKRRENNKKVLALIVQMSEMMATLQLLAPIKPAELRFGSESLAQRIDTRLRVAAVAIEECSHATHEYYKTKVISKLIKSNKWEEKFTDLATKFANFQSDFAADLAFYTGAGVQATVRAVGKIDEKITMLMKLVFNVFASPEENELMSFIKSKGGSEEFIKDDKLLLDLIKKHKGQQAQSAQEDDRVGQGKASFDLGNSAFDDTKKELTTDLNILLDGSRKTFVQLFEEQKDQITAVRDDMRRESDRIVGQLLSGAHDRVLDKHIHAIWVGMGWKGSTKTLDLVLALRDFYVHHHQYVSPFKTSQAAAVSSEPRGEAYEDKEEQEEINPNAFNAATISPEDAWAIRFLSRSNLSPLMEAVDSDCSGHVTIKEINDFTSSRPKEWSLPQWVAYWTVANYVGFEVTSRQYCVRIRELFSDLHSLYDSLIPGNAGVFSSVITSQIVEHLIGRVHTIGADDKEDEYQNQSFQAYAEGVEKQLEKRLERLNYLIDDSNTLSLVTGPGRLEECFFPLVYLLLHNCFRITKKGLRRRLQFSDFNNTFYSFYTLWNAASERVAGLKRCDFKLRNISITDEFRRYSYGMYYYMIAYEALDKDREHFILPESEFYPSTIDDDDEEADNINPDSDSADDAFEGINDINSLDYVYQKATSNVSESPSLVGTWSGFYYYGFSTSNDIDGIMSFQINDLDTQGMFTGGGSDTLADFSIDGTLDGKTIMFSKKYSRRNLAWAYSGEINEELDTIEGKWGRANSASGPSGMFVVEKKSAEFVQFYPSKEKGVKKNWRLLWKFAINVTLHRRYIHTVDICSDCVNKSFTAIREKGTVKLDHLPTHLLLQIRRPLSFLLQLPAREDAQDTFYKAPLNSNADDNAGVHCNDCGKGLARPYWACCDCDHVYICASCNTKTEQWRPWLYERIKIPAISSKAENIDSKNIPKEETGIEHSLQGSSMTNESNQLSFPSDSDSEATTISSTEDDSNSNLDHHLSHVPEATTISSTEDYYSNPNDEHDWSHDLVLCASPGVVSLPLSLEGRVIGLEKKLHELQEQTKSLQGGMGKLEAQLERLEQLLQTAVIRE